MIDIHTHVLPAVDDGARDLAEALAMCQMAARDGCRVLVATPHQHHPAWANEHRGRLESVFETLRAAVGDAIELRLGAEIRIDSSLLDEVEALPGGHLLPLGQALPEPGRPASILLELERLPPRGGFDLVGLLHELLVTGWRPILAHPELIPWLAGDHDLLAELAARGVWLQVTAMSLTGDFGRGPQATCNRLLEAGLIHVVASDCHGALRRPPGLSRAHAYIESRCGELVADLLTRTNPARALGLPVAAEPVASPCP